MALKELKVEAKSFPNSNRLIKVSPSEMLVLLLSDEKYRGLKGDKGETIVGPQGLRGPPGESIVGPQGIQGERGGSIIGPQGERGVSGAPGSVWFSGAGAPTEASSAKAGDYYLDTSTGDVYEFL